MTRAHFLEPAVDVRVPWGLRLQGSGVWLARRAELADTSVTRRRGLRGVAGLPEDQALVIAPTQGIHTFGMQFPLDLVGVSRGGVIVDLRHAVPRNRIVIMWRAFAMVEMASGAILAAGCAIGDRVSVEQDRFVTRGDISQA